MSNITIQVDEFENFNDALWLFDGHAKEVGDIDQDDQAKVSEEAYKILWENDMLHIVSVRDGDKVVGYHVSSLVLDINHECDLSAHSLVFYLHSDYRRSGNGRGLIKHVEKTLREKGVKRFFISSRKTPNLEKFFERLGFEHTETVYLKNLGGK